MAPDQKFLAVGGCYRVSWTSLDGNRDGKIDVMAASHEEASKRAAKLAPHDARLSASSLVTPARDALDTWLRAFGLCPKLGKSPAELGSG